MLPRAATANAHRTTGWAGPLAALMTSAARCGRSHTWLPAPLLPSSLWACTSRLHILLLLSCCTCQFRLSKLLLFICFFFLPVLSFIISTCLHITHFVSVYIYMCFISVVCLHLWLEIFAVPLLFFFFALVLVPLLLLLQSAPLQRRWRFRSPT